MKIDIKHIYFRAALYSLHISKKVQKFKSYIEQITVFDVV